MYDTATYFTFQGEFYKQNKGAAMGSPISPVVANLYMEQFESRALDTAPTPPTIWYRYVDETMAKIHENAIDSFSEHLTPLTNISSSLRNKKRMAGFLSLIPA